MKVGVEAMSGEVARRVMRSSSIGPILMTHARTRKAQKAQVDQPGLFSLYLSTIATAEKVEGSSKVLSRASWLADAYSTSHLLDASFALRCRHLDIFFPFIILSACGFELVGLESHDSGLSMGGGWMAIGIFLCIFVSMYIFLHFDRRGKSELAFLR